MESPPMILPKGIVLNIDRVYKEVASYPTVPPEKIFEYWHVYTTTFNRLKDPTANRLENFWWHVMGSDRRLLSGPTLARLFEHISTGPTFVPLRGPPNRYEGPSSPPSPVTQHAPPAQGHAVTGAPRGEGDPSSSMGAMKPIPSSSSKPPPPHPILKKPRGPSTSGPRPTARFASPPKSEGEDDTVDSENTSSAGTPSISAAESKAAGSPAAKERQKKPTGNTPKKKAFHASTASKRRPAMPRRPSSQSSTGGSEIGSKEGSSSSSPRFMGSQRPVPAIAERLSEGDSPKLQESNEQPPSATAASKRPADRSAAAKPAGSQDGPVVAQEDAAATPEQRAVPSRKGKEPVYEVHRASQGITASSPHRRSDAQERARPDVTTPAMIRSRSDIGTPRPGSQSTSLNRRVPPQALISSSTATTSNVAAQGTIIEFDENAPARKVTSALKEQEENPEQGFRASGSSVLESHFTPTAPSDTPPVPLGRSKSQLTLLLERQGGKKARR